MKYKSIHNENRQASLCSLRRGRVGGWMSCTSLEYLTSLVLLRVHRQDRRLSSLITSDLLPLCLRKPLCNAVTRLPPDRASHHPHSFWSAPSFFPATSSPLSHSASHHTGSVFAQESSRQYCSTETCLLCTRYVFYVWHVRFLWECSCVTSISWSLSRRIIRPEITQRARRNVFKNIQTTNLREGSPHLHKSSNILYL